MLACAMADRRADGGPGGRPRLNDPLLQEVRWRLFRREDLPARLRRLERLEETAFGREPEGRPAAHDEGKTGE
jgi:hypothetical protein